MSVFANSTSAGEDHSVVFPRVLGECAQEEELAKALDDTAPDIILLRDSAQLSEQVARLAKKRAIPMLAYNLKPLTQRRSLRDRLRRRMRGLPLERVTPVPGLDERASPDPRAHYLPWPVARDPLIARTRGRDSRLNILCVGKLMQPRKNQHLLVQSIRAAGLAHHVSVKLVGSTHKGARGVEEQHLAALKEAAREDWVDLVCDHPFHRMGQLYAWADVCVLPAVREPLGYAPAEAMAYGVIPVISVGCGSAGYITPGYDGYRVNMKEPGQLGRILRDLIDQPSLREALSKQAEDTAMTELGPARFLGRMSMLMARFARN